MEERGVTDDLDKEGGGLEDGRRGPEPRNAGNATVEAGRGQVGILPWGLWRTTGWADTLASHQ